MPKAAIKCGKKLIDEIHLEKARWMKSKKCRRLLIIGREMKQKITKQTKINSSQNGSTEKINQSKYFALTSNSL